VILKEFINPAAAAKFRQRRMAFEDHEWWKDLKGSFRARLSPKDCLVG